MNTGEQLSRRSFLKGAGVAAAGMAMTGAAAGLTGCAEQKPEETRPAYLPESWDKEADIVVVGMGGAGLAAGITAADEALGDVLVLEAAPEEEAGGNTRVSMNLIMIPKDVDGAIEYQTALNDYCEVEPELMQAWAENICANKEWMEGFGIELVPMNAYSPEFPELKGSQHVQTYCVDGVAGNASGWNALKEQADYLGVPIEYGTRAMELVRNPETNEALGVLADQNGTTIAIKARKGVVLACGGFENDPEMCRSFLDLGSSKHPYGTPWNRGDGFRMVNPFGAQLWHMNSAAGAVINGFAQGMGEAVMTNNLTATITMGVSQLPIHTYLFVGKDGKRFMYEETNQLTRHGKISAGGVYRDMPTPKGAYAIFDETVFANLPIFVTAESGATAGWSVIMDKYLGSGTNQDYLDAGVIVKAETIEELAELIPVDSKGLVDTVNAYNGWAMQGQTDPDFHRGETVYETHVSFGDQTATDEGMEAVSAFALQPIMRGPFYAMPLAGAIVNTQGGPKRNANGQIVDVNDEPIGRLFGAGEFGCIYGYMYNGGGNVSEAISSGRLAARSAGALASWDQEAAE